MKTPHIIKVFDYMYELDKRNLSAYTKHVLVPESQPVVSNSVNWVGHATTIINLYGKIIVTDPVAGNLGFIKRLVKPSVDLANIKADYILLTHGHMDHLNYRTLNKMNKDAVVICFNGSERMLKILGFNNVIILNAGEKYRDEYVEVSCLPAKHNGRRYCFYGFKGSNSYVIKRKDKSILFTGDTAKTSVYKNINADAAIMPVGCYKPDEFLKMHCSPEESFRMFKMSGCRMMIPVHYKTYILAQDDDNETLRRLKNLNDGSIKIIDIGETVKI